MSTQARSSAPVIFHVIRRRRLLFSIIYNARSPCRGFINALRRFLHVVDVGVYDRIFIEIIPSRSNGFIRSIFRVL